MAQIPSGEAIESPIALIRAFRAGAPANHIFAPHPNERSKAFLGPPLLTPHQAQLHACQGPATGGKDLLLLIVALFGKREVASSGKQTTRSFEDEFLAMLQAANIGFERDRVFP